MTQVFVAKVNNIPEWANWLARDEDGLLYAFEDKPFKSTESGEWIENKYGCDIVEEIDDTFSHVKWTDEEPTKITHELNLPKLSNNPDYYNVGGIENIDIIKAILTDEEFRGYLKGNILKYREQGYGKARIYYEWLEEAK